MADPKRHKMTQIFKRKKGYAHEQLHETFPSSTWKNNNTIYPSRYFNNKITSDQPHSNSVLIAARVGLPCFVQLLALRSKRREFRELVPAPL